MQPQIEEQFMKTIERRQINERQADYEWKERIHGQWEFSDDQRPHGSGNLEGYLEFDEDRSTHWTENPDYRKPSFYEAISSPLLLYRLAATFDMEGVTF